MENNLKLIDGIFSVEDAKKILLRIINTKINHHKLDDFSNNIRFNISDNISNKRILELEGTLLELEKIISLAAKNNMRLKINSEIQISLFK